MPARFLSLLCATLVMVGCDGTSDGGPTSAGATSATSVGGSGEASSAGGAGGAAGGMGGSEEVVPEPPASLTRYLTGADADADVAPGGPGLILMGGGADVDAAFAWWRPRLAGGDVVVLRTSGSDGYNAYLYGDIGGADSVETMLVDSSTLADDPYIVWRIAHAEGIFIAGGDQSTYVSAWKDRGVEQALMVAWERGAVIGGTSAGCAILGEVFFAAHEGTVYSDEALEDPYNVYMSLDRELLALPLLAGAITDTHFAERDRMGRLIGFVARAIEDGWLTTAYGLGVDEATALVVDESGTGEVLGQGSVYLLRDNGTPQQCTPGQSLEYAGLQLHALAAGDTLQLPAATTSVPPTTIGATGGETIPADPY